jgi:predicted CopG family antitoxin
VVRYRTVSIRDDVYQRLNRLAVERGKSLSDLIDELIINYVSGINSNSVVNELSEIKAMLRECLDRLGAREARPIETGQAEARLEPKGEVIGGFEDNPWVQILRAKSGGGYGSQSP